MANWSADNDAHLSTYVVEGYPQVVREGNKVVQHYMFDQPWEVVFHAHESRYPTHPDLPMMVSSAVVSRESGLPEGCERFTRNVVLQTNIPRLLSSLVGGDSMEFEEVWDIDRSKRIAKKTGRNLSFCEGRFSMQLTETLEFTVHEDNPNWVRCEQAATMNLPSLPWGMTDVAQGFFAEEYLVGILRARQIDQTIIEELIRTGGKQQRSFARAFARPIDPQSFPLTSSLSLTDERLFCVPCRSGNACAEDQPQADQPHRKRDR